jgi:hypothetical protein
MLSLPQQALQYRNKGVNSGVFQTFVKDGIVSLMLGFWGGKHRSWTNDYRIFQLYFVVVFAVNLQVTLSLRWSSETQRE